MYKAQQTVFQTAIYKLLLWYTYDVSERNPVFDCNILNTMFAKTLLKVWQVHLLNCVMLETGYQMLDALLTQWVASEVQLQKMLVYAQCLGQTATPSIANVVPLHMQIFECNVRMKRLRDQLCTLTANLITSKVEGF